MLAMSSEDTPDIIPRPLVSTGDTGRSAPLRSDVPLLKGYWVDACIYEQDHPNCDPSGQHTAADAWCKDWVRGSTRANGFSIEFTRGHDHDTYRYTYKYVSGRQYTEWDFCHGCGFHFTEVNCV